MWSGCTLTPCHLLILICMIIFPSTGIIFSQLLNVFLTHNTTVVNWLKPVTCNWLTIIKVWRHQRGNQKPISNKYICKALHWKLKNVEHDIH